MIEEIVTAAAPKKTKKTEQNEAEILRIGEETETYITDEKTRQKLLDLLTAKINSQTAAMSMPKSSISPIVITVFFVLILIGGFLIMQNENGKGV